jgi:hypothetical protein
MLGLGTAPGGTAPGAAGFKGAPGAPGAAGFAAGAAPGRAAGFALAAAAFAIFSASAAASFSAISRKCFRTNSACERSSELECVFFSVTPISGKNSIRTLALISSSRASSLMRI